MVLFTRHDIEENEELTFSYHGLDDDDDDVAEGAELSAPLHASRDKIYRECLCGADNCKGILFS